MKQDSAALTVLLSIVLLWYGGLTWLGRSDPAKNAEERLATRTMTEAIRVLSQEGSSRGFPPDPALDPNRTGLIGLPLSDKPDLPELLAAARQADALILGPGMGQSPVAQTRLLEHLTALKLISGQQHYTDLATEAAQKQWTHVDYLARLIEIEAMRRQELSVQRRIAAARFPCVKTLDQFDWNWPKKINRTQIQNLFRLAFLPDKTNVIFIGGVGLGIMPGTGLCRAVWDLALDTGPGRLSARHNPEAWLEVAEYAQQPVGGAITAWFSVNGLRLGEDLLLQGQIGIKVYSERVRTLFS